MYTPKKKVKKVLILYLHFKLITGGKKVGIHLFKRNKSGTHVVYNSMEITRQRIYLIIFLMEK